MVTSRSGHPWGRSPLPANSPERLERIKALLVSCSRSPPKAGELCRPSFVADVHFWRHNSCSQELRYVRRPDHVGALEVAPERVGVRFCREVVLRATQQIRERRGTTKGTNCTKGKGGVVDGSLAGWAKLLPSRQRPIERPVRAETAHHGRLESRDIDRVNSQRPEESGWRLNTGRRVENARHSCSSRLELPASHLLFLTACQKAFVGAFW